MIKDKSTEAVVETNTLPNNRLLSGKDLASYIGMSLKFISKHTESGRLPGIVRCGRLLKYDRYIIDRRLAEGKLLLEKQEIA
jgi:predicted DNA-binding transcriptional regulator AlpA